MRIVTVRPARRCAVCHAEFAEEASAASCLACQARAHVGCFLALARCPTLGCGPARRLPATAAFLARPEPGPPRGCCGSLLGLGLGWCLFVLYVLLFAEHRLEQGHEARVQRTAADMKAIGEAIELFRADVGRDPERLSDLWERPADPRRWGPAPYLREYPPKDPWGNEYVLEVQPDQLRLVSYGADGAPGGAEETRDLAAWTVPSLGGRAGPPAWRAWRRWILLEDEGSTR